jgi:MoaA/NifB/PqqE/SkfB family radical SAM enzyme
MLNHLFNRLGASGLLANHEVKHAEDYPPETPLADIPAFRDAYLKSSLPYPERLNIGLTSMCKLKCIMCHHSLPGRSPNVELTDIAWQRMQPAIKACTELTIAGSGDPLLHRNFVAMMKQLAEYPPCITIYTSMNFWGKGYTEAVTEAVNDLCCSIDAATPETYEQIRVGGDFSKVIRNIKSVVALRAEKGYDIKRLRLSYGFIPMRKNLHEMPRAAELAAELGMDAFMLQPLFEIDRIDESVLHPDYLPKLQEMIAHTRQRCDELGIELHNTIRYVEDCESTTEQPTWKEAEKISDNPAASMEMFAWEKPAPADEVVLECTDSYHRIMIVADGNVLPCWDRYNPMGNLNEEDFDAVWMGAKFQTFRRRMMTAGDSPCRGCVNERWIRQPRVNTLPTVLLPEEMTHLARPLGFWALEQNPDGTYMRWTKGKVTFFMPRTNPHDRIGISVVIPQDAYKSFNGKPLIVYINSQKHECAVSEGSNYLVFRQPLPPTSSVIRIDLECPGTHNQKQMGMNDRDARELGLVFVRAECLDPS